VWLFSAKLLQDLADAVEMEFNETSAKEDINVKETFLALANNILTNGAVEESGKTDTTITITSSSKKPSGGGGKCCSK